VKNLCIGDENGPSEPHPTEVLLRGSQRRGFGCHWRQAREALGRRSHPGSAGRNELCVILGFAEVEVKEGPRGPNDVNDCESRGGQKEVIPRASQAADSGGPISGRKGWCTRIPFGPPVGRQRKRLIRRSSIARELKAGEGTVRRAALACAKNVTDSAPATPVLSQRCERRSVC